MSVRDASLSHTIWRGLQIAHPADWETAAASGPRKPARLTLADRYYQRLEARWRPVDYHPNFDQLLEPYRRHEDDVARLRVYTDLPPGWVGVERTPEGGTIIQAARYLEEPRWLLEITLVWPDGVDVALQRRILESVRCVWEPESATMPWQAMGMRLEAPAGYEMDYWEAQAGAVQWAFAGPSRPGDRIVVRRLGLVDYWLKGSLGDWLEKSLPKRARVQERSDCDMAGHRAVRLTSTVLADNLLRAFMPQQARMDLAWQCEREKRVYQVCLTRTVSRGKAARGVPLDTALPGGFRILCCNRELAS